MSSANYAEGASATNGRVNITAIKRELIEGERFVKLPKWAQERIQTLEMRVREVTKHANELAKPAMKIAGEITHGHYEREKHCESNDQITFYIDAESDRVPRYIQVRWRDPDHPEFGIEINGSDTFRIDPRASNVVWVALGRPEHG